MLSINVDSEFDPERLRRAVEHLSKAVEAEPKKPRYRKVLGEARLAARQFSRALVDLEMVYEAHPEPRVAYLLAYAYHKLGNTERAGQFLDRAASPGSVGFSRLHLLRGHLAYEKGDYLGAYNEYRQALEIRPAARGPRWQMARALVAHAGDQNEDTGNLYRRAQELLQSHEPDKEERDQWHYLIGRVYLALRYPVDALRHLEQSRVDTSDEKALLLGVACLLKGARKESIEWLKVAAARSSTRGRTVEFLREVAATPPDFLSAMGPAKGASAHELVRDAAWLAAVFGPDAPETKAVLDAARGGVTPEMIRTQLEDPSPVLGGRLFADDFTPAPDCPPTNILPRTNLTDSDRIHPQTALDVTEMIDVMEFDEFPDGAAPTLAEKAGAPRAAPTAALSPTEELEELADDGWDLDDPVVDSVRDPRSTVAMPTESADPFDFDAPTVPTERDTEPDVTVTGAPPVKPKPTDRTIVRDRSEGADDLTVIRREDQEPRDDT